MPGSGHPPPWPRLWPAKGWESLSPPGANSKSRLGERGFLDVSGFVDLDQAPRRLSLMQDGHTLESEVENALGPPSAC